MSRFEAPGIPWLWLSWFGCGRYPGQPDPSYQNTGQGGASSGNHILIKELRIPIQNTDPDLGCLTGSRTLIRILDADPILDPDPDVNTVDPLYSLYSD